ncbi:MAG: hypothetical protein ACRESW_01025, partial [Nevskiales bacterium]
AGVQPQRDNPAPCEMGKGCSQSMIERAEDFRLGYVQFDDQGRYSQPGQVERVMDEIGAASAQGLILAGFTHGWKEDAGADRWSVAAFKTMLAAIAGQERRLAAASGRPPRQVAGVFLGWPGRIAVLPPFAGLTWFDREDAAERIARGDFGDALLRLKQLRDTTPQAGTNHQPENQLILAGHSLGATMLYQRLVKEPLHSPGAVRTPLADLVLLLSPAIPATDVAALEQLSAAERATLPPIIAITSENDITLRLAFPLGQWLKNAGAGAEDAGHSSQAMGLYPPLITHRLEPAGADLSLVETGRQPADSAVLQITASHVVMQGHKDIANPRLVDFIANVMALQLDNRLSNAALASAFPGGTSAP